MSQSQTHGTQTSRGRISKDLQKEAELRCITAVATERGCTGCSEAEKEQWPDGWLTDMGGSRIPVEVVAAVERATGEDPRKGAAWMRAKRKAERLVLDGHCSSYFIDDGVVIIVDEDTILPVSVEPLRRDLWIAAAVRQKLAKSYDETSRKILVVHLHSSLPLDSFAIPSMSAQVRLICGETGRSFREVWIVNDYDRAIRLPNVDVDSLVPRSGGSSDALAAVG